METSKKLVIVVSAAVLALVLAIGPAAATESGGGGGGGGEDGGKIELATNQHEFVGLILLGALGIGGIAALINARKQLRGERKQATGEWRWR